MKFQTTKRAKATVEWRHRLAFLRAEASVRALSVDAAAALAELEAFARLHSDLAAVLAAAHARNQQRVQRAGLRACAVHSCATPPGGELPEGDFK